MDFLGLKTKQLQSNYPLPLGRGLIFFSVLNTMFFFLTAGILGFVTTFLFTKDNDALFIGASLTLIVLILGYEQYKKIEKRLEEIKEKIEEL